MPCSRYKGKQRSLCYATKEWKDWSTIDIKLKKITIKNKANLKKKHKTVENKLRGGKK